jgi:Flp pilus assembly protein TadD
MRFRDVLVQPVRRCVGVLLLGLVLGAAACAANRVEPPASITPGQTLTGNYLAARHARAQNDEAAAAAFLRAAVALAPDDRLLLGRTFFVLVLDGQVNDALPLARRYIDSNPDKSGLGRLLLAVEDIRTGQLADARRHLDILAQDDSFSYLGPVITAWTLQGMGETDKALAALSALSDGGGANLARLHAAWINDLAGRPAAAVASLQPVLDEHKQPWLRLVELGGGVLARAGQGERARTLHQQYQQRNPGSRLKPAVITAIESGALPAREIRTAADGVAEALLDGAGILGRQNSPDTALYLAWLGLHLRPDLAALQMMVGDLLEDRGRYQDANRVYATVDRASPLSLSARLAVARNLDQMDRFDEAKGILDTLSQDEPGDADALSTLADMLRKRERFADAVAAYDAAFLRIGAPQPYHWRLLYARGIALERAKNWERAETDFLKALEFEPEQPFVLNYLGYSWVEQGRNLAEAERMIRKAVELRPRDGYIVDSLGWVLYRLGRYEESVPHLERAVELRPEDPVINDHLGDAYWSVGRQREARYQWQAALALKPEAELRTAIEAKLRQGLIREANAKP